MCCAFKMLCTSCLRSLLFITKQLLKVFDPPGQISVWPIRLKKKKKWNEMWPRICDVQDCMNSFWKRLHIMWIPFLTVLQHFASYVLPSLSVLRERMGHNFWLSMAWLFQKKTLPIKNGVECIRISFSAKWHRTKIIHPWQRRWF